jgi:hypothetical protein
MKSLFKNVRLNLNVLLTPALFIAVALFARLYVFADHKHPVKFQPEISHGVGYATDPAYYEVYVSPSQAWDLTHQTTGEHVVAFLADLFFWLAIVVMILAGLDILEPGKTIIPIALALLAWGVLRYTHFSNSLGYKVHVTEQEYKKAVDSPEGVDQFFVGKKLY